MIQALQIIRQGGPHHLADENTACLFRILAARPGAAGSFPVLRLGSGKLLAQFLLNIAY